MDEVITRLELSKHILSRGNQPIQVDDDILMNDETRH
jgi:hypothetical protein